MPYFAAMGEATPSALDRDQRTGRFLAGNGGNGGRKPGSRNKLGEQFVADLRDAWEAYGPEALRRCATEEPAQFVRVIAGLMPKDINLNVGIDPTEFAGRFRQAVELLGNPAPERLPRPPMKVINNGP